MKPNKFFTLFSAKNYIGMQLHKASAQHFDFLLSLRKQLFVTSTIKMTSFFFTVQKKEKKEIISNTNPFRRGNALNPMENSWILFCLSLVSNLSGNTGMTHAEETLVLYLCRSYNSGTTLRSTLEQQTRTLRTVFQTGRWGGGQRKKDRVVLFSVLFGVF